MGEYDENVLTKLELPVELDSYAQKLELGRQKFLKRAGEDAHLCFTSDMTMDVMNKQTIMGSCQWDFLCVYHVADDKLHVSWAWGLYPDDEQQHALKEKMQKIDVLPDLFEGAHILTEDENMMSVIMGILCFQLKYDHIYVHNNGEHFNMFGLRDIKWNKISKNKTKKISKNE